MSDVTAVKPSNSKLAAELRRKVFVERWLTNGNNAAEAARYAGFSENSAVQTGYELLQRDDVQALIGHRNNRLLATATLNTERWANEMAAIGHLDPGEFYNEAGELIPIHKLPEHVRRAVASVDHEITTDKDGNTTQRIKIKTNDKNAALTNIGRHLGVFERDNRQQVIAIQVNLTLVG